MLTIMEHIVEKTPEFIKRYQNEGNKVEKVIMDWTGPAVFTDSIFGWIDSHQSGNVKSKVQDALLKSTRPLKAHDTLILPRMAWGAVPQMKATPLDGKLVTHDYEGSWKPKGS